MPLIQSCSADARRRNIEKLIAEGKSRDQAVAITLDLCRRLRARTRRDDVYQSVVGARADTADQRAQQTAQVVQLMRAAGAAKRPRRRLPRQLIPKSLEREYAKMLLDIVAQTRAALEPLLQELPRLLESAARERRLDANEGQIARTLIENARRQMTSSIQPAALDALLEQLGSRVAANNRRQIQRQIRAALGADIFLTDAGLRPLVQGFAAENAALIKDIPDKIIGEVERATTRAITGGTLHRDLAKEINKRFAFGRDRSRLIARDQVGKLYGQINAERQRRVGVTHFFWRTSNDERVRDEHEALAGERFSYEEGGAPGEGMPGDPILCFPGETEVSSLAAIEKLYRRRYTGESTILTTHEGRLLQSTPNHPVLTLRGWKPAKDVDVGDYLVHTTAQSGELLVQDPEYRDPTIAQVFRSLTPLWGLDFVKTSAGGFHGDAPLNQEVDVVDADRGLGIKFDSLFSQRLCDDMFTRADTTLTSTGYFPLCFDRSSASSVRVVRGASKLLSLLAGHVRVPDPHRVTASAWFHSFTNELRSNGRAVDVEVIRELFHAPAGGVEWYDLVAGVVLRVGRRAVHRAAGLHAPSADQLAQAISVDSKLPRNLRDSVRLEAFDRVVGKRVGELVNCHVYNLQTSSSWYLARDIVVHNCRCWADPDMSGILDRV